MLKKKIFRILLALLVFGGIFYAICFFVENGAAKKNFVIYKDFYSLVENEKIQSVEFAGQVLNFTDSEGISYTTDNPESPVLKEYLMRKGIKVIEKKSSEESLSFILDLIFYIFFFGIIGTVLVVFFRRFIMPSRFRILHKTGVKFSDVIGMEALKQDMNQIIKIMKNPGLYNKKGLRMPKGILLEGEPGNGKTLFAKALAGEAGINFIPAKATDFESMFIAIGPMKVKLLFRMARKKAPCIIFIDEFDGIGTKRNYSGSAIETENTRIVTALLNELDGFEASKGVFVIAATNSVRALDEALIRPGRFDAKFTIPYPNAEERVKLIELYSKNKDFEKDCSKEKLSERFKNYSCAKIESIINSAALYALERGSEVISLDDIERSEKRL